MEIHSDDIVWFMDNSRVTLVRVTAVTTGCFVHGIPVEEPTRSEITVHASSVFADPHSALRSAITWLESQLSSKRILAAYSAEALKTFNGSL